MKRTLLIAVWAIGLMSDSAMALTLNEARSQGRVGETLNGYPWRYKRMPKHRH